LFAGKWMELEIIFSSEIKQAKEDRFACSVSYVEPRPKSIPPSHQQQNKRENGMSVK
jgi:hypothetical protein